MYLELKNLHKRFDKELVVDDLNLSLEKGQLLCILGGSGCGKTTTLNMIGGFLTPDAGTIHLDGVDITNLPPERRPVATVFQSYGLFPHMTVLQNVIYGLKFKGYKKADAIKKGHQYLEMVGLQDYANAYPHEISGGMLQRAGVIRAMVHDPEILLMDEPYGALDELTREQMNMELLDIWSKTKKTIIFITHNIEEAVLLSDKVYVMGTHPGRLVEVVDLELERPRQLSMITQPKFIGYRQYLESAIGEIDLSKIK